ncbi:Hypothetical protein, putative [Bodo saltans]|uniref:Uncharacterized protein n=1 Tax=Bodo saltans TaxID=75058 RepID=A0A0S4KKT3_BODSA|nr:Hypothetical protein, putative [Bodo saltans]|eukprot:CUI15208.1 Hypothetical protein, putative [Bodo saltans]
MIRKCVTFCRPSSYSGDLRRPMPQRKSLRRESLTTMLSRPLARTITAQVEEPTEEHQHERSSWTSLSVALSQETASSFITPGAFTSQFQHHVESQRHHFTSSSSDGAQQRQHTTLQQQHDSSGQVRGALASLDEQQAARRELFATSTPTFRLRKSRELYTAEVQRKLRNDEVKNFGNESEEASASSPVPSKYVDVPLLPPAYLRQRAAKHSTGYVPDDGDEDAERLHLAAARNILAQSDEPQLFRCLRCFHVFKAVPQTILRTKVEQMQLEVAEMERNRKDAERISRNPRLRKTLHSVGRRRAANAENLKGCPSCQSNRVQWALEYVHHRTHHKTGL